YVVEHDPAVLGRGVDRGTVAAYFDGPARPRRGPQGEAPATVRGVAAHADAHAALGGVRRVDLDRGAVRGDGGRGVEGDVEAGRALGGDVLLERGEGAHEVRRAAGAAEPASPSGRGRSAVRLLVAHLQRVDVGEGVALGGDARGDDV